jgi:hypothetical protein
MTAVPDHDTLGAVIAVDSPLAGVTAANALAERLHASGQENRSTLGSQSHDLIHQRGL